MGLIKAAIGSISSVLADQWKEYFYCDSLSETVLVAKGIKKTSSRSSNTKGSENVISNGSVIVVNEGQCMMIVQEGAIVEFSAEAGAFTWDASTEPTIFYGGLGAGLAASWETLKRRFTFGGDAGKDQRVYYFNLKEITGNNYGTPNPVPFRVVDRNIGLDMDIAIRCNGEYSYKISNPMLFYKNVCGNVADIFTRNQLDSQLKAEFLTALQPAFSKISDMGIRYSSLPGHTEELAEAMNATLSRKWGELRGISVVSVGVNSVNASVEDETMIKNLQRTAVYRNPTMAGAAIVDAQAEAMKAAAQNEGGALNGFLGMNMATQAGGTSAASLFQMGQQTDAPTQNGWKCKCGTINTGKFCVECGSANGWNCPNCGSTNKGNFCSECGSKKPSNEPLYRCDKCGWEPEDPKNPPKFCPQCGDRFDNNDIK